MKLIKQISNDIAENVSEAKDKIRTAYELKAESPEAAAWYREMASAHLGFNSKGHEVIKKLIENYKNSEEYKRNPAFADGMLGAWNAIHDDLIAKTAEVKAMVEGFK
jgi:hypothetical protein|nr:MAG TPA_asm: hypothetical protein [Caudoviricetes sp.]